MIDPVWLVGIGGSVCGFLAGAVAVMKDFKQTGLFSLEEDKLKLEILLLRRQLEDGSKSSNIVLPAFEYIASPQRSFIWRSCAATSLVLIGCLVLPLAGNASQHSTSEQDNGSTQLLADVKKELAETNRNVAEVVSNNTALLSALAELKDGKNALTVWPRLKNGEDKQEDDESKEEDYVISPEEEGEVDFEFGAKEDQSHSDNETESR